MAGLRDNNKFCAIMVALTLNLGFGFGVSAAPASSPGVQPDDVSKVVINVPSRTLWVYSGRNIVRYFPVGVGRPGFMTPVGRYKITTKVIDPGWEHPYVGRGMIRIAPGAGNPLGTRWMGFHEYKTGEYGMHGTDRPSSVGKFSSHGCVRMLVKDAETLFEMVEVGTPVEVTYDTVLIRPRGNEMRITVYPDAFKRGMPSADKVMNDIKQQYPSAKVEIEKVQAALASPAQQPVLVGVLSALSSAAPVPEPKREPIPTASAKPKEGQLDSAESRSSRETTNSMHDSLE
jgi:hypothetical protein